ncbi:MAG TPA: FAD-dependent oxidoreductase [Nocardioidaceae bacterium]|nr:FAD-dependent oxidoreductase [Nocardioidaceae bacterium]
MRRILVVGGSLAGHRTAHALREQGFDGELTVLGAEPHPPYDRYPLSKDYLTGSVERSGLDIGPLASDITWRWGAVATGVDLERRQVSTASGAVHLFDGLVVATGARARGGDLIAPDIAGAFVVRTVTDAERLRGALAGSAKLVVVVGGGLIGAEIASVAAAAGHRVTLVDRAAVPTVHALGPSVAAYVHRERLRREVQVVRRRGSSLDVRDRRAVGVLLDDGARLAADVVVFATGTSPNTEWLAGSGLQLADGLVCRPTLHAYGSDAVVGVGDVARVPAPLLDGDPVRAEHWSSARLQAVVAAENLLSGLGAGRRFDGVPVFATTLHGARARVAGFPGFAEEEVVLAGDVLAGRAVVGLRRAGVSVGVVALNADAELREVFESERAVLGKAHHDCQQSTI